jgi:hypothetical protein
MKAVFSIYFRHHSVWIYFTVLFGLLALQLHWGVLLQNLPLAALLVFAPFYEWVVHKFFLHLEFQTRFPQFQAYLNSIHSGHHEDPKNIPLCFAPVSIGLLVPIQAFLLGWALTGQVHIGVGFAFMSEAYYLFYEWMHLAHHMEGYRPQFAWGGRVRRAHTWHHYKNENYWWGVTSNLGDRVLGTMPDPRDVSRSGTVKEIHA